MNAVMLRYKGRVFCEGAAATANCLESFCMSLESNLFTGPSSWGGGRNIDFCSIR